MLNKPLAYLHDSVWANNNRYYVNGKIFTITSKHYKKYSADTIIAKLEEYRQRNSYDDFNQHILKFIEANKNRLRFRIDEAHRFILQEADKYPIENIVLSFSGGKDSTVTADLATKALGEP
ncbi:MAG: phosphoadenosine phosphosulfate reductase, partial [Oscillospiraceae bacterium]|nr:phosphoadenosine phosphosulfate reductase [Oscillospiraceae bacterium]